VTGGPEKGIAKSYSQIVAELEATGRPVASSLRQFAEAEQSGDVAIMLGFERPSRQRRAELFGKAIDPWNHKEADEERRREGLPPVYFRRLRRHLKKENVRNWVVLCAQTLIVTALLVAGSSYLDLKGFRDSNLSDVKHLYQCRKAAVEIDIAPSLRGLVRSGDKEIEQRMENEQIAKDKQAATTNVECLRWARSGFGTLVR
jgi:hypothetical protein